MVAFYLTLYLDMVLVRGFCEIPYAEMLAFYLLVYFQPHEGAVLVHAILGEASGWTLLVRYTFIVTLSSGAWFLDIDTEDLAFSAYSSAGYMRRRSMGRRKRRRIIRRIRPRKTGGRDVTRRILPTPLDRGGGKKTSRNIHIAN